MVLCGRESGQLRAFFMVGWLFIKQWQCPGEEESRQASVDIYSSSVT